MVWRMTAMDRWAMRNAPRGLGRYYDPPEEALEEDDGMPAEVRKALDDAEERLERCRENGEVL